MIADFIGAALPWVLIGLAIIAIVCSNRKK